MRQNTLRYQISLFGSFDEIIASNENIKFFIDNFSDRGFIPNQFIEVSVEIKSENNKSETTNRNEVSRLRLNDKDKKWDIRFASDRIDFFFVNSNIGQIEMIDKNIFKDDVYEFIKRINNKFNIKAKRLGFVTQYLYDQLDLSNIAKSFQNNISFFETKQITDWNMKMSSRQKSINDEIINSSMDLKHLNRLMKINNDITEFNGILLNIDINTLSDNEMYRFNVENIKEFIDDFLQIENNIYTEINSKFV
ncbi:hypothetical protein H4K35_11815 [Myroides sp. NP-2]|uniref:hypothetical protein n=1 Tax=Myroides sp. NP-2 TaxID=2759945 RepID=UPI0015FC3852|nr:hypothetical protein [Myroides sp. NP-2]MBB1150793.1 hypothetical protein [Myroides sp. NP-2]